MNSRVGGWPGLLDSLLLASGATHPKILPAHLLAGLPGLATSLPCRCFAKRVQASFAFFCLILSGDVIESQAIPPSNRRLV